MECLRNLDYVCLYGTPDFICFPPLRSSSSLIVTFPTGKGTYVCVQNYSFGIEGSFWEQKCVCVWRTSLNPYPARAIKKLCSLGYNCCCLWLARIKNLVDVSAETTYKTPCGNMYGQNRKLYVIEWSSDCGNDMDFLARKDFNLLQG